VKSVRIDGLEWMAENLDVDTFRNGDPIPEAPGPEAWREAAEARQPAWCRIGDPPGNGPGLGRLYNWYAVCDPRGLPPRGWRVPTDSEWERLVEGLGGAAEAGGRLKASGLWRSPNFGASNESGFSVWPAGYRDPNGGFHAAGFMACFWTDTEISAFHAWSRYIYSHNTVIRRSSSGHKGEGLSMRCVRG